MEPGFSEKQPPVAPEEKEKPSPKRIALTVLSYVFFGIAAITLLVMIYIYTAKDLTVSPYLAPSLNLSLWGGIGFGMLFRTFLNKEENVSPINFASKLCFSVLVLLVALLAFLSGVLNVLRP